MSEQKKPEFIPIMTIGVNDQDDIRSLFVEVIGTDGKPAELHKFDTSSRNGSRVICAVWEITERLEDHRRAQAMRGLAQVVGDGLFAAMKPATESAQ